MFIAYNNAGDSHTLQLHFNETIRDGGYLALPSALPTSGNTNTVTISSASINNYFYLPTEEPSEDKTFLENGVTNIANAAMRAASVAERIKGNAGRNIANCSNEGSERCGED